MDMTPKVGNYMRLNMFRRVLLDATIDTDFGKPKHPSFIFVLRGRPMPSRREVPHYSRDWSRRRSMLTRP